MKGLRGFSLVELIVVIAILSILSTISFLSLQGYGADARDGRRLADISTIISGIEEIKNDKGYYELPDEGINITYSGGVVWRQGVFGDINTRAIGPSMGLNNAPVDPLSGNNYTYSVLNTRKEFQLAVALEAGYDNLGLVNKANAGDKLAYTYINGNYNGKLAKVSVGDIIYILAVPTIINNDVTDEDLLSIIQNSKLAYNGSDFLPGSYANTKFDLDGDGINNPIVNFEEFVVYEGNGSDYTPQELLQNTQDAYEGVTNSNESIEELLVIAPDEIEIIQDFADNVSEDVVKAEEVIPEDIITTIYCLDKEIGEEFTQGGITYKVVEDSGYYSGGSNGIKKNISYIDDTHNLCTSHITNMSKVFNYARSIVSGKNIDISSWDVSNVIDMSEMFSWTYRYANGVYIGPYWDTSKVENMSEMFYNARYRSDFSGIESWDTSNVKDMSNMFQGAQEFNHDISSWDTSSVENMSYMFNDAREFNQDISSWNVSSVENMLSMFNSARAFNQSLNSWDTSNVTNMGNMFFGYYSDHAFNHGGEPLTFDTSKVTNMAGMFSGARKFDQNINALNTSNVESMASMFGNRYGYSIYNNGGEALTIDTSKVKYMSNMFEYANYFNQDISSFDTSNVENMSKMFYRAYRFNQDIGSWNTSKVTNMYSMFENSPKFDQDISSWDVSKVTNMQNMFKGDWRPQYSYAFNNLGQALTWNTSSLTNIEGMFAHSDSFNQDVSSFDISGLNSLAGLFNGALSFDNGGQALTWNTSGINDFNSLFTNTSFNQDISSWNTSGLTSMSYIFLNTPFNQDISSWDVSSVTDMSYVFSSTPFDQDISLWDVSNVEYMKGIFSGNASFNQDISSWDVGKIKDISYAFNGASSFNQDISGWEFSSDVKNFEGLFYGATNFDQPLNSWDTSSVTNMRYMFAVATNFDQPLNSWDTSSVDDMSYMFDSATSFDQPLNSWDTTLVDDMQRMFRGASSFDQSLNSWDTSKVTKMTNMFSDTNSFNGDISSWDTSMVNSIQQMFLRATSFNQDISGWDSIRMRSMQSAFESANSFDQDLSSWCVSGVSREPYRFLYDTISGNNSDKKPKWGQTCN